MPEFCKYCESETTTPCRSVRDANQCAFYDGEGSYDFMEVIPDSPRPTPVVVDDESPDPKIVVTDLGDDFGFSFEDDMSSVEVEQLKAVASDAEERMVKMYSMIDTFLGNLSANPEKPTIRWPNRAEAIDKFRKQLKALMKG